MLSMKELKECYTRIVGVAMIVSFECVGFLVYRLERASEPKGSRAYGLDS